jgi:RNA polymerase sigma-70 factor, ECF subfamily
MKPQMTTTELIWTDMRADLRRFIRRRVADDHVADDLLQEAFVRIHRHIDSLADADRLAGWVYQIARNVIHDHYRRSAGAAVVLGDGDPADDREGRNTELRCRSAEWLEELIAELPSNYRDALRLAEIDGLTQQEVADRLGLSLSGAKSRIQRGRTLLRGVLEECCRFEFDRRGNLLEVDPRPDRTVCRDCDDPPVAG